MGAVIHRRTEVQVACEYTSVHTIIPPPLVELFFMTNSVFDKNGTSCNFIPAKKQDLPLSPTEVTISHRFLKSKVFFG